jgi:glutaminyl-tRNA synthetase
MGRDESVELLAVNNPEDGSAGRRKIRFTRELWIERDDFAETPPPKYYRLYPGNSVRLRYGFIVTCTGFDRDAAGNVSAVRAVYDPATKGGDAGDNRKVKGTIHWVPAPDALPIEVRVYDHLFTPERPMEAPPGGNFVDNLNPASVTVVTEAVAEPCLARAVPPDGGLSGEPSNEWPGKPVFFQFERQGYFVRDSEDGPGGRPAFNKTLGLRDTWAKIQKNAVRQQIPHPPPL